MDFIILAHQRDGVVVVTKEATVYFTARHNVLEPYVFTKWCGGKVDESVDSTGCDDFLWEIILEANLVCK